MRRIDRTRVLAAEEIVEGPIQRACSDQTFELPTGLYVATALMFAGFVAVLGLSFSGHMAVSLGVIFAFIAAFFVIPSLFIIAAPDSGGRALKWREFLERGIDTATGHTSARSATVLVLALPVLIMFFALAVATIAAIV